MKKFIYISLIILGYNNGIASAQNIPTYLEIDLSRTEAGASITENILAGKLKGFIIRNRLPLATYTFSSEIKYMQIDPLTVRFGNSRSSYADDSCSKLSDDASKLFANFENINSENKIPEGIATLKKSIGDLVSKSTCLDDIRKGKISDDKDNLISKTIDTVTINKDLRQGEQIIVTLSRIDTDKNKKYEWTINFKTEKRGVWLTSFGLGFISNVFQQQIAYVIRKTDSSRVVTQYKSRGEGKAVPAVFFTYVPTAKASDSWVYGLSGGFGYDSQNISAFMGGNITYNSNVSLIIGIAVHREPVKDDRFYENQTVVDITDSSLLNRSAFQFSPFFGFSYRFGDNPFSKDSDR